MDAGLISLSLFLAKIVSRFGLDLGLQIGCKRHSLFSKEWMVVEGHTAAQSHCAA